MPSKHSTQGEKSGAEAAHHRQSAQPVSQEMVGLLPEVEQVVSQGVLSDLSMATPDDILTLQRSVGNRTVHSLIQAKLTVGPVGDRYEQEADRVAQQVMSRAMPVGRSRSIQRQEEEEDLQMMPLVPTITPVVQRQEEEEEDLQMQPLVQRQEEEEEEDLQMQPLPPGGVVQRQEEEEEEDLQMQPLPPGGVVQRQEEEEEDLQMKSLPPGGVVQREEDGSFEAGSDVESRLSSRKGSGDALPDGTRADMESRFGADFSGVRVHADGEAVQLSQELGAKAFTHGRDIYFGSGKYDPDSSSGQRLLAHELTHVVQQTGGHNGSRSPDDSRESSVSAGAEGVQRALSNSVKEYLENEAREEDQLGRKAPERISTVYGEEGARYWNRFMEGLVTTKTREADLGTAPDAKWDQAYKVIWDLEMRSRVKTALLSAELGAPPPEGFSPGYSDYWKLHMTVRLREEVKTAPLGTPPPELANEQQKEAWRTAMDQRIDEEPRRIEERERELKKGWGKTFEGKSLSAWLPTRKKQKRERGEKLEQAREDVRALKRMRGAREEKTPWQVWQEQREKKKQEEEAKKKELEKTEEEKGEEEKKEEEKKEEKLGNKQLQSIPIEGLPNPKNYCFLNSVLQVLAGSYKDLFDPTKNVLADKKKAAMQASIWKILQKVNKSPRLVTETEIKKGTVQVDKVTLSEMILLRTKLERMNLVESIEAQEDATELMENLLNMVMPDPGEGLAQEYALGTTTKSEKTGFGGEKKETVSKESGIPLIRVPLTGTGLADFLGKPQREEWSEPTGKNTPQVEINGKTVSIKEELVTTTFSHLPRVLTFQLGRFDDRGNKIKKAYDMPQELTISEVQEQSQSRKKYELESYIYHYGETSRSGHYTAGRKIEGQWYEANDETVSGNDQSKLNQGYLYTYKLVGEESE